MKRQEIMLNTQEKKRNGVPHLNGNTAHALHIHDDDTCCDDHVCTGKETPLRPDAFELTDDEKIESIAEKFADILHILGLDLDDDSLKDTPRRVAKMYVKEIFSGLHPARKPSVQLFDNPYQYNQMLVEKNITVHSYCEHHLVPIIGVAHVAYISSGKVIGLSKINRIVRYFSKRPQVQERLTEQIAEELKKVLQTEDVAVYIDAEHFCVKTRGIEDTQSTTVTTHYSGKFLTDNQVRQEFLSIISKK
ncbi:GTP cyclohydrolase 1 [Thermaurantimonas aggregans]|uniref:GTP cyclohydrolase 1 n=1 Tax=Thermaurantimonas aggregans TaxID=2173829 RepID=A0A401XNG0_9FLAO|nr:GTP cyclohydrolase I FolE [Thermaurantimonas aggregans]MCX8147643.1 GTP cyclohydrolase I FolE [Thermaurantimonas aggregans]GCD78554.1 GTP cyclohydrolase 1 [Thermaurantimonas aggregans]